jgi:hypothetical protein
VPLLLTGFVGSLLAMLLVVLAPGNAVRQAYFTQTTNVFVLVARTFSVTLSYIYNIPRTARIEIPLVITIAVLTSIFWHPSSCHPSTTIEEYRQKLARKGLLIVWCWGIAYILIMSTIAPSIYGLSFRPPGRALFIPQFIFFCTLLGSSSIVGLMIRQVYPAVQHTRTARAIITIVVVGFLVVSPLRTTWTKYTQIPAAQAYADALRERDRIIRQAIADGKDSVVVPYLGYNAALQYNDTLAANPSHWVSQSMRSFYGITVTSDETIGLK